MTTSNRGKLGLVALIAIAVSSMIGAGIDALPQNMADKSAILPVIIAWCIAGFGVFFIAKTFIILNKLQPELQGGIYGYAKVGFGSLTAFFTGLGYWLMCICSNVAYGIMLMSALDYFVPGTFNNGNNLASIIGTTILIWGFNRIVAAGIKDASIINIIGTIAKLVPLLVFVLVLVYFVRWSNFDINIWGHHPISDTKKLGSVYEQIMAPLDIALWCFIGIEGAVVLSARAKEPSYIGRATIISFFIALFFCMLVSILPFGVMPQAELAELQTPSTAGVFKYLLGEWGEFFISLGVIISVLTAWLAWTILCAEIPLTAAQDGTFPKSFKTYNKNGAASVSLTISSCIMQIVLIFAYFAADAWVTLLEISTLMVLPAYLFSTLYLLKISCDGQIKKLGGNPFYTAIVALIGAAFCIFMFCISDLTYVLVIPIILTLGLPLYIYARYENRASKTVAIFTKKESLFLMGLYLFDISVLIFLYFK